MDNYKIGWFIDLENDFNNTINDLKFEIMNGSPNLQLNVSAIELVTDFLNERYKFYFKHYNCNLEKMDNFIYNKLICELKLFSNFSYKFVASNYEPNVDKINKISKILNSIVNDLESYEIV